MTNGSSLRLQCPRDYLLSRDFCSYGYFLLAPNRWDPQSHRFSTLLTLPDGVVKVTVSQGGGKIEESTKPRQRSRPKPPGVAGAPLRVECDRTLDRTEQAEAKSQLVRMLRLDEDDRTIRSFHKADPRWKKMGRGRLMRSTSLFQDVVRTVTSCNVTWPSTVHMNERLCAVVGGGAFPTAKKLKRTRASTLRARCRVGYRDKRLVQLADLFASGAIDEERWTSSAVADDEVFKDLVALPGIGPYAAANIMQLLGRYGRLPLDTESVRHGRVVLGMDGTDAEVMRRVGEHFAPFGEHAFRSYWFELWDFYESRRGPSWLWDPETTGKSFTATQL